MHRFQAPQRKKILGWLGLFCFLVFFAAGTGLLWNMESSREFMSRWNWFLAIRNSSTLEETGMPYVSAAIMALCLLGVSAIPLILVKRRALEETIEKTCRDWPLRPDTDARKAEVVESEPRYAVCRRTFAYLGPVFLSLGVILLVYQMIDMGKDRYRPLDLYLWFAALLSMALGAVLWDKAKGVRFRSPIRWFEWIWVSALTVAVFLLYSWDLESWRYTIIADQYSFFDYAKRIISHVADKSAFAQDGVYDKFPVLGSHFQSWVMQLFGVDRVGWLYASCLVTALTVIPTYIFARCLFTPGIAFISSWIVGVNHFQIAFAHLGYNNAQSLLPVLASLAFLVWALRTESRFGYFASGLSAGLGFYTFHTARLGVVFAVAVLVFYAFKPFRLKRIPLVLFFCLGLAATILPTNIGMNPGVKRHTVLGRYMQVKGIAGTSFPALSEAMKDPVMWGILKRNAFQTAFLPICYCAKTHFVWGPLMDALTGPLAFVGFLYAIAWCWKRNRYCVLLFFLAVSLFVVGMLHSYEDIPATRVQFVVPFVAFFAAISLEKFLLSLKALLSGRADWPFWGFRGAVVIVVAALCMHRIYVVAPSKSRAYDCALTWRAALETGRNVPVFWIIPSEREPENSLSLYRSPNPVNIYKNSQRDDVTAKLAGLASFLVVTSRENPEWDEWVRILTEKYPDGWTNTFYDNFHMNFLRVYGHGVAPALGDWKPEH